MSGDYTRLVVEREGPVGWLIFDRPDAGNALDAVMFDELVAHRLGLIPLKTDLNRYNLPEDCDCKSALGCPKCRVLLVLDAEATDKIRTVN